MDKKEHAQNGKPWFSATDWAKLLYMASLYGYDPSEQRQGAPLSWEELDQLAEAVELALDDIPNHNATGGKKPFQMSPFEWFSGPRKSKLKDFLAFCKQIPRLRD